MVGKFTKEEFTSQAEAWERVLKSEETFPDCEGNIIFFGAGVAYYAAKTLAWTVSDILKKPAFAVMSQDLTLNPSIIPSLGAGLFIAISRTGTVSDNIAAIKAIKSVNPNYKIYAVVGEVSDEIGRLCDYTVTLDIHEESVATTKTISSIILAAQVMLSKYKAPDFYEALTKLPDLLRRLTPEYEKLSNELAKKEFGQIIFTGTGAHYGIAEASALAVLEMSVERCFGYQSLVYLHGHCVTSNFYPTLVVAYISTNGQDIEVKALDTLNKEHTTLVCLGDLKNRIGNFSIDMNTGIPDTARSILYLPFAQILGITRSINRGFNPDSPPNLKKVF
ncbi:SIS domain-containing protein [Tepidanaerobacter acetatoxydans]|uniref:SIS domain-containing protein n=1 Tax=Tepidanaerobacter acetatoxydans TaxID=499229 RepID=UPI001BD2ED61|nr:SIS domain-containing protein [Tepidanaerobacter acetatoxydans]